MGTPTGFQDISTKSFAVDNVSTVQTVPDL